jgi:hypothetical protein
VLEVHVLFDILLLLEGIVSLNLIFVGPMDGNVNYCLLVPVLIVRWYLYFLFMCILAKLK